MSNSLWVEKYRPKNLENYIGNEHLKSKVEHYLESGDVPHLLLYGKAGTGKTTLAKLIINNIECDYLYINASDENNVDTVRTKVKNFASTIGFKDTKVIILDEGKKAIFSKLYLKYKLDTKTVGEAEHKARTDPEYETIIKSYAHAESELINVKPVTAKADFFRKFRLFFIIKFSDFYVFE